MKNEEMRREENAISLGRGNEKHEEEINEGQMFNLYVALTCESRLACIV